MKKLFFIIISILFILTSVRILTYPNFKKLKEELNVDYKYPIEQNSKITYNQDVEYEKKME